MDEIPVIVVQPLDVVMDPDAPIWVPVRRLTLEQIKKEYGRAQ